MVLASRLTPIDKPPAKVPVVAVDLSGPSRPIQEYDSRLRYNSQLPKGQTVGMSLHQLVQTSLDHFQTIQKHQTQTP